MASRTSKKPARLKTLSGIRGRSNNQHLITGISLTFVTISCVPVFSTWFESSMTRHMLLQLPLLAIVGAYLTRQLPSLLALLEKHDPAGATALVLGTGTMLFWMIPLHLDLATIDPLFRFLKVISIPLGIGLCFYWVLRQSNTLVKLVIVFEAWAAVTRLGWLFLESPDQLCSSYLIGEQQSVGSILLTLSVTTAIATTLRGLCGRFDTPTHPSNAGVSKIR